jgi:hypothetical protein
MSWLSSFVEHNRDFAGNALKNISPLAFLIPGVGPLAAAGLAGAGSALGRGIQHGSNLKNIVGQGLQGAGEAYAGGQGMGALRSAFGGGQAAGSLTGAFTPSSTVGMGSGELGAGAGDAAYGAAAGNAGNNSILSAIGSGAKGVGHFIQQNPMAVSGALQGAGQIGQMGSENAMRKAQTTALDLNNQQSQYEQEAKKRRDAAMAPLLALFQGQLQNSLNNPYQPPRPSNGPHYQSSPYSYG